MAITKRSNGKYTAQVSDPATGKRRSLGTYDRLSDAKSAVRDALERREHHEPLLPEPTYTRGAMPFDEFVRDHFLTSNKLRVSDRTRRKYEVETNRLVEFFGKRPLNSITNDDVLAFNEWFRFVRDAEGEPLRDEYTSVVKKRSDNCVRQSKS